MSLPPFFLISPQLQFFFSGLYFLAPQTSFLFFQCILETVLPSIWNFLLSDSMWLTSPPPSSFYSNVIFSVRCFLTKPTYIVPLPSLTALFSLQHLSSVHVLHTSLSYLIYKLSEMCNKIRVRPWNRKDHSAPPVLREKGPGGHQLRKPAGLETTMLAETFHRDQGTRRQNKFPHINLRDSFFHSIHH